jgi:hypothetical protein
MDTIRPSAIFAVALVLALGSIFALAPAGTSSRAEERPPAVLYFTHSAGYRHEVIPVSQTILKEIGTSAERFEVTASEDVAVFTPENLRRFGAVMFFTTGELPMSEAQKAALVEFLGPSFSISDEIYQIADFDDRGSQVLLRLDPTSVDLKVDGVHPRRYGWPLAWTRSYGEGRVFYTALGHEEAVWRDPRYQHMLRNAVLWAMRRAP